MSRSFEIVELVVFPIKSCKGYNPSKAEVVLDGFKHDRKWMVVDANNKFVSQREKPIMCFIRTGALFPYGFQRESLSSFVLLDALEPTVEEAAGRLNIQAPDMPQISVPLSTPPEVIARGAQKVTVWSDTVDAYDLGDSVAEWFSKYLGGWWRNLFNWWINGGTHWTSSTSLFFFFFFFFCRKVQACGEGRQPSQPQA